MSPLGLARLGAMSYALWALIHLYVAWAIYSDLAAGLEPGLLRGRVEQTGAFMALIAALVLVFALAGNTRNDRAACWLNLALVSGADLPWIAILVVPGHESLTDAWPGLVTWAGGALGTTAARLAVARGEAGEPRRRAGPVAPPPQD